MAATRPKNTITHLETLEIVPNTAHGDIADPYSDTTNNAVRAAAAPFKVFAHDANPESATPHFYVTDTGFYAQLSGGCSLADGKFTIHPETGDIDIGNGAFTVDGTTGAVSSANATFTFSNPMTVNAANASTTGWVRSVIGSCTASGTGMTTGYGAAGVRGIVTMSGTTTGQAYYYGTQGKWVAGTGSFDGGGFHTALCGQLDLTGAATYTSVGCLSALWLDAGASAHANAITAGDMFNMIQINNTTAAIVHSAIKLQGSCKYFIDASDVVYGGTGNCVSGAGSGTVGALKCRIAGQDGYIKVYSSV